ncbi:MAG: hypothetical protein C0424_02600 [Sphingobacteriaceae bacterium]|nr:hypothetical protein [Sphingobacteriaceae bacterium]
MRKWTLFLALFVALGCSPKSKPQVQQPEQRPSWVMQRPIENGYYVGIGVSRKMGGNFDHLEQAKKNALNDLVSQIQVTVQANSIQSQMERNRVFSDEFRSFTRLSTNVAIESFETVATWQNEQEYWVYYRLSASEYQRQKELRMQQAVALSIDALQKAREAEAEGSLMAAYDFYFRALEAIKAYTGDPLTYEEGGKSRFLGNDLMESMNRLSRNIAIRVNVSNLQVKPGRPVNQEIVVMVSHPRTNGKPIRNFPLHVRFTQGAGTIVGNATTDENGVCRLRISSITARDALQEISIGPDMQSLVRNDKSRQPWLELLDPQSLPNEKIIIEVSRPVVLLVSDEKSFGQARANNQLEAATRQRLQREGVRFTDKPEQADFRLVLSSDVRQGTVNNGMYTCLLDLKLQLADAAGQEKYSKVISPVRGVQLDYQRASDAAYRRAAEDLELSIIPSIIHILYAY